MLIIPVGRKPDWRHTPVVSLLLVLINCLVFFGLQLKDQEMQEQAAKYYFTQGLHEIEFPRYQTYLRRQGDISKADKIGQQQIHNPGAVLGALEHDRSFIQELNTGLVIKQSEGVYDGWKLKRAEFERQLGSRFTERYAFDSRELKPVTFLSHMFMHANFAHLFGNMLMLLLVGYIVEEALGGWRFLLFYLVGGIGALGVFIAASLGQETGLVGASGAIASVMGMYSVLFGLRKIEFFYWILIYFDLARLPAIILLPVWVGLEIYQKLTNHDSNVAYMAHAGGLLTGALLVYASRKLGGLKADALFELEEKQAEYRQEMEKAAALVGKLDLDRARQAYFTLLDQHPGNPEILGKLYGLCKSQPLSPNFQRLAAKVFALAARDAASVAMQAELYLLYAANPKSSRLPQVLALELIGRFISFHHLRQAEHLLNALLNDDARDPKLPGLLMALSKRQRQDGKPELAQRTVLRLQQLFPDAPEARLSATLSR